MSGVLPREGMMATLRNRRAIVRNVEPFDAGEAGRFHLVEVEYTDGRGAENEEILWEIEIGTTLTEASALPNIHRHAPMEEREFDAMLRAIRWSALTPSLPFSGLTSDRLSLASPLFGAVHPESYQLVPILRALEMPRVALMLADAVGLGKTIQAGMVLRELMLRRRIRRILILCPAALRTQWRDELKDKFSLAFTIVDRPHTLRLQRELGLDASPWRTHEHIITSYHYLKQADVLEHFRSLAEPREDGRLRWDLLIVDEAHNLAPASFGQDSDLAALLQQIAPWFEHRLFLTATPHNGHTRSFSGLLEALDPVRFTRKSELNHEDRSRVAGTVIRRLKSDINKYYTQQGQPPRFCERYVQALPPLHFSKEERCLLDAFSDFRKQLKLLLKEAGHRERTAANFACEVLQKRLLSGPWAFGQSWLAMRESLETNQPHAQTSTLQQTKQAYQEETDDDAEQESRQRHTSHTIGAWLKQWQKPLQPEISALDQALHHIGVKELAQGFDPQSSLLELTRCLQSIRFDARFQHLEDFIQEKLRSPSAWRPDERLVIFTEYLATLSYLFARLRGRFGEGGWLLSLYGGMRDQERDAVKSLFNQPQSEARILIATDAAGEGLNLQRAARYLLHWDIPWNPARMEQRNGRLDRHGQERDVFVYHFDSTDDASLHFLGKVLRKRSQTREDRVATDEIFSDAIMAHFEEDQPAALVESDLDSTLINTKHTHREIIDDLPDTASPLPKQEDEKRLQQLKDDLDLSPESLRETLETALAIGTGRPRLEGIQGRHRFVHPIPHLWKEIVDQTLRSPDEQRGLLALVFDPAHYVKVKNERPVYLPEEDSRLLHLGHALFHRVMSTFAQYRFPGTTQHTQRWLASRAPLSPPHEALILLTVEELAVNELREPCHHWVHTHVLPVEKGALALPLPHQPPHAWKRTQPPHANDTSLLHDAREIWDEIEDEVKDYLKRCRQTLQNDLEQRMAYAKKITKEQEEHRFKEREKELKNAIKDTQINKLEEEIEKIKKKKQLHLFAGDDQENQKKIRDLEAEIALRKGHYEQVMKRLEDEKKRVLNLLLPKRYTLRGEVHVYPVAIEIRLNGGAA